MSIKFAFSVEELTGIGPEVKLNPDGSLGAVFYDGVLFHPVIRTVFDGLSEDCIDIYLDLTFLKCSKEIADLKTKAIA
jgi:hypothetical protein